MRLSRPAAVGKFTSPAERAQRFGLPILDVAETSSAVSASVCGAGYKLIDVLPLEANPGHPLPGGKLEVFYNASNGKNCLVEQALGAQYGKNKRMFVSVCRQPISSVGGCSGSGDFDGGDFKYYAGPVYATAPHQCIYYGAAIYEGPTAHHGNGAYGISGKGYRN